nr:autoinducer binding domain-containing protein [Gellertiella hungarica]
MELLVTTEECRSADEVLASFRTLLTVYGFEYYAILRDARPDPDGNFSFLASKWPAGWPEAYAAARHMTIDPALRYLSVAQRPFRWSTALKAFQADPLARQMERMMAEAASYGLKDGYIFPIHGRGGLLGFVSVGGRVIDLSPTEIALFQAAFKSVYWKMRLFLERETLAAVSAGSADVTKRELEVLWHLANGLTSNEISKALGISRHTVDWYTAGIQEKLGAKNRQHAVAIAFRRGLIS